MQYRPMMMTLSDISSGTWSLMGIERKTPDCSPKSCELNFTNEGGYAGRFRYLKNIMGLWMIQSVRHEVNDKYSFAEICSMAEEAKDFPSRVDANDECFLSPENMTEEVKRLLSQNRTEGSGNYGRDRNCYLHQPC